MKSDDLCYNIDGTEADVGDCTNNDHCVVQRRTKRAARGMYHFSCAFIHTSPHFICKLFIYFCLVDSHIVEADDTSYGDYINEEGVYADMPYYIVHKSKIEK